MKSSENSVQLEHFNKKKLSINDYRQPKTCREYSAHSTFEKTTTVKMYSCSFPHNKSLNEHLNICLSLKEPSSGGRENKTNGLNCFYIKPPFFIVKNCRLHIMVISLFLINYLYN